MKPISRHVNRLRAAFGGAIREPLQAFISPDEDGTGVAYADTGDQYAIYVVLEETRERVIAYYSPEMDLGLLTAGTAVQVRMNDRGQYDIIGANRAALREQYRGSAFTRGFSAMRLTLATITTAIVTLLRFGASTELTIASGAITVTRTRHTVDTESDGASDDLDTINGGVDGDLLIIRPDNAGRTVVVTEAGNIVTGTGASITLDDTSTALWLVYDGTLSKWFVIGGAAGATGASVALDNLAGVAINTSLVSDTDNTDDLGSASVHWRHAYTNAVTMTEGSAPSTPASNNWSLYFKTDGVYVKDDVGGETGPLGASSGSTPTILSDVQVRVLLHEETLASAGRFDVSSISSSYDDLYIEARLRGTVSAATDIPYMFFNNDTTTSNYAFQRNGANNGGTNTAQGSTPSLPGTPAATATANHFEYLQIYIPDYTDTNYIKIAMATTGFNYGTPRFVGTHFIQWNATTAINQITIQPDGYSTDNFAINSKIRIWGVTKSNVVTNVT